MYWQVRKDKGGKDVLELWPAVQAGTCAQHNRVLLLLFDALVASKLDEVHKLASRAVTDSEGLEQLRQAQSAAQQKVG